MYTIVDLCILCLKKWTILKNMLSEDSNGVRIEDKLKYLCELAYVGPEISKQICLHCLETLNHSYVFKQQCIQNVIKFNSYIHTLNTTEEPCRNLNVYVIDIKNLKLNDKSDIDDSSSDAIKLENLSSTEEPRKNLEVQTIDNKNLESNQEIGINDSSSEVETSTNFNLDNITLKIEKEELIIENDEVDHEIINAIVKKESEDINDEIDINPNLEKELVDELQKDTTENENTENLPTSKTIPKKSGKRIKKTKIYKCSQCHNKFSESTNLYAHIRCVHNIEPHLQCDVCGYKCRYKREFTKHQLIHPRAKPVIQVKPVKPYKCKICYRSYSEMDQLTKHKLNHLLREIKCAICGKKFDFPNQLKRHMYLHTGDKPLKCEVCGKGFIKTYHLKRHRKTHTREKPYKCDVCDDAFFAKHKLFRHKRTHKTQ